MNFRHLSVFRALMKCETATAAASLLGVSQPAVSQALRQMEHELGLRLFERLNGRLYPTPEAQLIFPEVTKVERAIENMHGLVEEIRGGTSGTLTIATLSYAHIFLPPALQQFRRRAPGIEIGIHVMPTRAIVEMVAEGVADIGIVTDSADPHLTRNEDLPGLNVICALPPDSPLRGLDTVTPRDLRRQRLLSYDPQSPFGQSAARAFASYGERLNIHLHVASSTLLCSLVEQGLGVALLEPFIMLGANRYDVVVKTFEPRIHMKPRLIFSRNRPPSMAMSIFKDCLVDHSRNMIARCQ